ncbi:MAG: CRISPR-associated helicase Cas3' [Lachnospiraceae bacterium]|nr:CRISPR-associated helicase Cas3' [Lachnospiraceae bacterium]
MNKDIIYEAHPGEALIHHLQLTADLAEKYGKEFGSGRVTRQLGLLHDVGKHTLKFQKVLTHDLEKIDHAIVAAEIYNDPDYGNLSCYYNQDLSLHLIISRILAGHHSSFKGGYDNNNENVYIDEIDDFYPLPDDFSEQNVISNTGKQNAISSAEEYIEIGKYVKENGLVIYIGEDDYLSLDTMDYAAKMLYARMLFSCLVDADYTASANIHCDIDGISEQNIIHNPENLSIKLEKYRQEICGNSDQTTGINHLRAKVYRDAYQTGQKLSQGIYTMTAPTGTGKTLALIKFAIEQAKKNGQKRIFIILPFLSIISQNAETYRKIFGDDYVVEDDSIVENDEKTREYAEKWDMPIIVTTSVKFFQTLFAAEAPALRRLHQVANSVVVFDESQTLPSNLTSITMRTLKALPDYFGTTVLLSTATQPRYEKRKDLEWNVTDIIEEPEKLYQAYDKIKNTNSFFDVSREYEPDDLAEYFSDRSQVLYICNTTKKAKRIYDSVVCRQGSDEGVYLLTSRLCNVHKAKLIQVVRERLAQALKCHLISTQGIEAGVDIDFPCGCREYAPFTSITQAAGRINRNGKGNGEMLVFRMKGDTQYDFPDQYYQNEAGISYALAKESKSMLNINDLKNISDYYQKLYSGIEGSDKREIKEAEQEEDIYNLAKAYKLMENKSQYTVIVPYDKEQFAVWQEQIRSSGYHIKKKDMRKYQNLSVQIIGNSKVGDFIKMHCHQLMIRTQYGDADIPWFIADKDSIYDDKLGLLTEESGGGLFL